MLRWSSGPEWSAKVASDRLHVLNELSFLSLDLNGLIWACSSVRSWCVCASTMHCVQMFRKGESLVIRFEYLSAAIISFVSFHWLMRWLHLTRSNWVNCHWNDNCDGTFTFVWTAIFLCQCKWAINRHRCQGSCQGFLQTTNSPVWASGKFRSRTPGNGVRCEVVWDL